MKRKTALATLVATLVLLTSCSLWGDGESEGDPLETVQTTRDPDRRGPAAEVEGAVRGGTVTVLVPGDGGPASLDPTAGWAVVGNSILQALTHRSLTQFVRGSDGQAVLVPDLATDLGRPDETFTRWRFTIREDATWEDGRPVTAEQVAFGITRSFDDENFPSGPGTLYTKDYFAGADGYRGPYLDAGADFSGVRVEGRDVVIDMARPFPHMDRWGAFMAMGPVPSGQEGRPATYGTSPKATGPYKVESFTAGESLVLVRNDEWRAESDPGRHQYVDRWVFRFDHAQKAADDLVLSGSTAAETTVVHRMDPGRLGEADRILGDRLVHLEQPCLSLLAPDHDRIPSLEVRRALAHSFDHTAVWGAAGEVPGVTRTPAQSLTVPGAPDVTDGGMGEPLMFDPARARSLLAQAGHAPGEFEIVMAHARDDRAVRVQEEVTRGLEAGGFRVVEVAVKGPVHELHGRPRSRLDRRLNLRQLNWCADWPETSAVLPNLIGSGQPYNLSRFSDAAVDDEIARIHGLAFDEQSAAWAALAQRVQSEFLPVIPTGWSTMLAGFGSRVGNPSGVVSTGAVNYKDLHVIP